MTHGRNRKNFNAYTAEEFIAAITRKSFSTTKISSSAIQRLRISA
jgi:hypothetical protein